MANRGCIACDDTGFVVEQSGSVSVARRCGCQERERGEPDLAAAGVPRRYLHCTFDSYVPVPGAPGQKAALAVARAFAESYPAVDRGILFTGTIGTGKTHLAVAVLRALVLEQGVRACFADYLDLLKRIQATFGRGSSDEAPSEWDVLAPVLEADLLVLDDLGARRATPWEQETIGHLLTVRYNEQRTTLITTNLVEVEPHLRDHALPPGLTGLHERVDERVLSRVHEMCRVVHVGGEDYRRRQA